MTRRELAAACGLTGFGSSLFAVALAYAIFRPELDAIHQMVSRLERSSPVTVSGGHASVAITPTSGDLLREQLIERFGQQALDRATGVVADGL